MASTLCDLDEVGRFVAGAVVRFHCQATVPLTASIGGGVSGKNALETCSGPR
jgi:hypothetical protein